MMGKTGHVTDIHFESFGSKRVTKIILAADLFTVIYIFHNTPTIFLTVNAIISHGSPPKNFTISNTLYVYPIFISGAINKRLLYQMRMLFPFY